MIPHRQRPPKVPRRKWRMKREPNRALFPFLADSITEKTGQKHEVVVVDPDEAALCGDFGDFVGEELVYFFVGLPGAVVEGHAGLVVEDWPEDGVYDVSIAFRGGPVGGHTRKVVIVLIRQLIIQKNTHGIMLRQALRYLLAVCGVVDFDPRPSEPGEFGRFGQARQRGNQATAGDGRFKGTVFHSFDGDGETVGDDDEASGFF